MNKNKVAWDYKIFAYYDKSILNNYFLHLKNHVFKVNYSLTGILEEFLLFYIPKIAWDKIIPQLTETFKEPILLLTGM